jgi:Flp pilus assembly protein TadB
MFRDVLFFVMGALSALAILTIFALWLDEKEWGRKERLEAAKRRLEAAERKTNASAAVRCHSTRPHTSDLMSTHT